MSGCILLFFLFLFFKIQNSNAALNKGMIMYNHQNHDSRMDCPSDSRQKSGHTVIRILLGVLVVFLVLLIFLPFFLSTSAGTQFLLNIANKQSDVRLDIAELNLGWFSPCIISDISASGFHEDSRLHVRSVHLNRGLFAFLKDRQHIGEISIDAPTVVLQVPEKEEVDAGETGAKSQKDVKRIKQSQTDVKKGIDPYYRREHRIEEKPLEWPFVKATLNVSNASIYVIHADRQEEVIVERADLRVNLLPPGNDTVFNLDVQLTRNLGFASLEGTVSVPENGHVTSPELIVNINSELSDINLEAFQPLIKIQNPSGKPEISGVLNGGYTISGSPYSDLIIVNDVRIENLQLPDDDMDLGDFSIESETRITPMGIILSNCSASSSFFNLRASGIYSDKRRSEFSISGDMKIEPSTGLLRSLGVLDADIRATGDVRLEAEGATEDGFVILQSSILQCSDFTFSKSAQHISEPKIELSARGLVNIFTKSAEGIALQLKTSLGSFVVNNAQFEDFSNPVGDVQGECQLAMEPVLSFLHGIQVATNVTHLEGAFSSRWQLKKTYSNTVEATVDAILQEFRFSDDEGKTYADPKIDFRMKTAGSNSYRVWELSSLELKTKAIDLLGAGRFSAIENTNQLVVNGNLGLDLPVLAAVIKDIAEFDIEMAGKSDTPFSFESSWESSAGPWAPFANANALCPLKVQKLSAFGMDMETIEIPLTVEKGLAKLPVHATVNQGRLSVEPEINFREEVPSIVFTGNTNILSDVQVTDALANQLLALIHPLFYGASGAQGKMNLSMASFYWPLDPKRRNEAKFSGGMVFKDVSIRASGAFYKLLEKIKVRERDTYIGDRDFDFFCKNGKIRCTPMKIKVDDQRVTVQGTMTLDQVLDYSIETPVTEDLVGREAYPYLKDTTFRIPIRGPVSNPDINMSVVQEAIGGVLGQALENLIEEKGEELLKKLFK